MKIQDTSLSESSAQCLIETAFGGGTVKNCSRMMLFLFGLVGAVAVWTAPTQVHAQGTDVETPTSSGRVAQLDTPIFRIPKIDEPPTIDGPMKKGEWQGASALSGFWYDFGSASFQYLAPDETQVEVYGAYTDKHLYIAYRSPVYPEGSWLKQRGRYPDVTHHARYGLIWDDHIEMEIRPYPDNQKGFQLGLFKWFVNASGTVADQYWSKKTGMRGEYNSKIKARNNVTATEWTLEMKIPLERLKHQLYAGKNEEGEEYVSLPPPPETAYRVWFTRGIGGNGAFYNVFDSHVWNTTKTKMILDPDTVSFQINELGGIMEDRIDVRMTVKNHSDRSQTMRLGFFVESAAGTIYSSYNSSELKNGLLELVPGEVKEVRLKKAFPGISTKGNTLWFDVRQAGTPAKSLFRTRLIDFHAKSADMIHEDGEDFRSRRLDVIAEELRPPRKDFTFTYEYSKIKNRLGGVVDTGIRGASEEAKTAREAKLSVLNKSKGGKVVTTRKQSFEGEFATFLFDLPELNKGDTYTLSLLLFDENKRIVGEKKKGAFGPARYMPHVYEGELHKNQSEGAYGDGAYPVDLVPVEEWIDNDIGEGDVVWEPFTKMEVTENGFETLKHRFQLKESGLPAQIFIKPHDRNLPLEVRKGTQEIDTERLQKRGRGPQLREPMKLVVKTEDQTHVAEVRDEARLVKEWDSELVYRSKLTAGPLDVTLKTRYDVDGSMHCSLTYGPEEEAQITGFHLVSAFDGPFNIVTSGKTGAGMAGADVWNATLPHSTGVVWDSTNYEKPDLFYSHFVPILFFGTGDRGFTWYATSDKNWELNRTGSSMSLARNENGDVTWRVQFVNHETTLTDTKTLEFHLLTQPSKPKPRHYRKYSWLYRGDTWAKGYQVEPVEVPKKYLKDQWRFASKAPDDVSYDEVEEFQMNTSAPWPRFGRWRHIGIAPEFGPAFEQRGVYYLSRQIRTGRRTGWWWDESWPGFGRTDNFAAGEAYLRDPDEVAEGEIPWQSGWSLDHMRQAQKRLARVFAKNNVPQRQFHWANHQATLYSSVSWDTQLVEEAGSGHRSKDIDVVTQFPSSLWRYQAHHFTGLVSRVVPGANPSRPGDDKRFDRQWLGRALLNDIGTGFDGPHGILQHVGDGVELINALEDFGYFKAENTEFLPYWRNEDIVRLGKGRRADAPLKDPEDQLPRDHLYVTAYRRPYEKNGQTGYKVLFVLMNEYNEPVRTNLNILKPDLLFGGPNDLRAADVLSGVSVPDALAAKLEGWVEKRSDTAALKDLEGEGFVSGRIEDDGETYGPVWVPPHDYRVLYGYSVSGDVTETK